ncbi:MAG: 16S rRNA (uracil(1498)-N(3))-methyltransferase [Bacteroides sp.]
MHLFYTPDIAHSHELPADEAAHALRVLRLQPGDEVRLTDGQGGFYHARISECNRKRCMVEVIEQEEQAPLWTGHLHLALAPTKNMDRMEWLAEKATEIGFDELTFLNCQWSERRIVKGERIEKILISAMKQSLKARLPKLNDITDFAQFVKQPVSGQKFIAHCHEGEKTPLRQALQPAQDALVLIGPEGDFSPDEVALAVAEGFTPVTLGNTRLRTETAALIAVHLMNLAHSTP